MRLSRYPLRVAQPCLHLQRTVHADGDCPGRIPVSEKIGKHPIFFCEVTPTPGFCLDGVKLDVKSIGHSSPLPMSTLLSRGNCRTTFNKRRSRWPGILKLRFTLLPRSLQEGGAQWCDWYPRLAAPSPEHSAFGSANFSTGPPLQAGRFHHHQEQPGTAPPWTELACYAKNPIELAVCEHRSA
jgi:hypothetical protein